MTEKSLKIGIVMDPIDSITPYKDSSLAMFAMTTTTGTRSGNARKSNWVI
jgi:hypothetical protein